MIVDKIENSAFYKGISENIAIGLNWLKTTDLSNFENGRYEIKENEIFVIIQDYQTKPLEQGLWEAHKVHIDIQYVIEGQEKMGFANIDLMAPSVEYDKEKDVMFFEGEGDFLTASKGDFVIFTQDDAHMPGLSVGKSDYVKKAIVKIVG